ncbi:uncharacterized protein EAE98_010519 [Botrytis deweyae]|uniref:2EXR domain-containing protein n=1 Tax=Botrytis deweyae TaxID=2478750 RepID=A0ABQ7I8F4_9HELO|nr:uncharacterized protein EAE98_010519 [Botrytis deweyae]KAF7916797.1 hypothetical protein EAE98_010519 [Botrytis deweyae]
MTFVPWKRLRSVKLAYANGNNRPHNMHPEDKLTARIWKNLSGKALVDELEKRRPKRFRALERRWKRGIPRRRWINLKKFPMRERHNTSSSFVLFSELPIELRIKIWEYSFRGRNVEVCVDFDISVGYDLELRIEFPNYPPRIFQCRTITPNPTTLFVNHESRMETLKCYSNFLPGVSDSPIYFNYQLDSFAVRHYCSGHNIRECDTREQLSWGIRHLIDLSTSVPLRPIRPLKLPTYFIYDYGIIDPPPVQNHKWAPILKWKEIPHSRFQIPEVTIYKEPLLLPIFCDEMKQANGSRVHENYDLKETADWFDSEF